MVGGVSGAAASVEFPFPFAVLFGTSILLLLNQISAPGITVVVDLTDVHFRPGQDAHSLSQRIGRYFRLGVTSLTSYISRIRRRERTKAQPGYSDGQSVRAHIQSIGESTSVRSRMSPISGDVSILTCVPEPPGDAKAQAVARAKERYDRLLKSAGRAMVGESKLAMHDHVDSIEWPRTVAVILGNCIVPSTGSVEALPKRCRAVDSTSASASMRRTQCVNLPVGFHTSTGEPVRGCENLRPSG